MKGITALLVVCALLAFSAGETFAAKKQAQGNIFGQVDQPTVEREFIPDPSAPAQGEAAPVVMPVRQTESMVPIPTGTYTIGTIGATYPSLSAAVFALNTNGIDPGANVVFEFIDPTYTDTSQTIGRYLNQDLGIVTFRPASGNVATITVTGGVASLAFCLRIDSAANLVWDGSNSGGTDRSLTLQADTVTPSRNAVLIQRGSAFITMKNMILKGNRRSASNGSDVVRIVNQGLTPVAVTATHDVLFENNHVLRGLGGIVARGKDASLPDYNAIIRKNTVGGAGSASILDNLANSGIITEANLNILVSQNDVYGIKAIALSNFGIQARGAVTGLYERNKIHDIVNLSGNARPNGFLVGNTVVGVAPGFFIKTNITISNNMVYDLHNLNYVTGGNTRAYDGIIWNPSGAPNSATGNGATIRLYHNTFWHRTLKVGAEAGQSANNAFMVDGNFAGSNTNFAHIDSIILINNVFATKRDSGFTRQQLWFRPADTVASSQFAVVSNNNVWHNTDAGAFAQYNTPWPFGPTTVVSAFGVYQTDTGLDPNSVFDDPKFVSDTDPHMSLALGVVSPAESLGTPLGKLIDIDGETRDANFPDAGADEFTPTYVINELEPIALVDPSGPAQIKASGVAFSPSATFRNNGTGNQPSAPVRYEILNSVPAVVYFDNATTSILALGGTSTVTFTPVPGGLAAGTYTIRAITTLGTDQIPTNDTLTSTMQVQTSISSGSFPYTEDFEGAAPEATGGFGWLTASAGGPNDWVRATPAKTNISGAHSGTKAYVTKATGTYSDNQESFVFAPILDLSSFSGLFLVQFYSNFYAEFEWDGGVLELSTDAGVTWSRVDSTLGTGANFNTPAGTAWYNNASGLGNISAPFWSGGEGGGIPSSGYSSADANGYVLSASVISGLGGLSDVRFRWHFSTDGAVTSEGWAIDDVTFSGLPSDDIGLASLGIPGYVGGPVPDVIIDQSRPLRGKGVTAPPVVRKEAVRPGAYLSSAIVDVEAEVKNYGANAQPSYSINWELDAVAQTPVVNTDPLLFGGLDTFALTSNPAPGFHDVKAWTVLGADANPGNDTLSFAFEVLDPSVIFYEGFNGTTFPPAGWDTVNNDANTGAFRNWFRSIAFPSEGAGSARGNFNSANGFDIDDWLITPNTGGLLDVAFTVDSLSFWLSGNSSFPDSLMILVSTSTTDLDSFVTVLDYVLADPSGYQKFTYALPDAANRYIAFRYLHFDGGPLGNASDNIFLDDVRITRYNYANGFLASPGSLSFGSVAVGFDADLNVDVINAGNVDLNISSITSSDAAFTVAPLTGVVAAGETLGVTVTFTPSSETSFSGDIVFAHDADSSPDTVSVSGIGGAPLMFLSLSPDTIIAKDPVKAKFFKSVKRAKPGKPITMPNWANLLDEVTAQGGFGPGASTGDSAGGMVIGVSHMYKKNPADPLKPKWSPVKDSAAIYGWVRLTKWDFKKNLGKSYNALQKTLDDKGTKHTGAAAGF
ncbi:MAG: choice-of-anchor D domain-containing protein, partial [Bacteroidota bacterium]